MAQPDSPRGPDSPRKPEEEFINMQPASKTIVPRYTCNAGYGEDAECFCVRFSPSGRFLATSFSTGIINVYKAELGGQECVLFDKPDGFKGGMDNLPTTSIRFRPGQNSADSAMLAVTAEDSGRVLHWDIKTKKCLSRIVEEGNQIFCVDYCSDGSTFATGGIDRKVRVYDEATKTLVQTLEVGNNSTPGMGKGHTSRILGLAFHPLEPHTIVSGGWDKQLQVWDTREGLSVRALWNVVLYGQAISFSADGNQILTGSYRTRNALQIWDLRKGEVLETVDWQAPEANNVSSLYAATFGKDERSSVIIAGGSGSNEAKFFDRSEGKATAFAGIINMPKPCFAVDLAPDGRLAAVGGGDGQIRVVEIKAAR